MAVLRKVFIDAIVAFLVSPRSASSRQLLQCLLPRLQLRSSLLDTSDDLPVRAIQRTTATRNHSLTTMKRASLNSNKSKARLADDTPVKSSGSVTGMFNICSRPRLQFFAVLHANETETEQMITLSPKALSNPYDGCAECFILSAMGNVILSLPGFPVALHRPLQKTYSVVDVLGKGVIAACELQAGDLIIDERPLLVGPANWTIWTSVMPSLSHVKRMQAAQEEQMVRGMTPEHRKAFEDLPNSRKDGISGPLRGRCKPNGFASTSPPLGQSSWKSRPKKLCGVYNRVKELPTAVHLLVCTRNSLGQRDLSPSSDLFLSCTV